LEINMKARNYISPIGRGLLALIFVVSGIFKLAHWSTTAAFMAAKEMPAVPLLLAVAVAVELIGGLLLLVGYQTETSAWVLFLYMIPVTFIFHNFWSVQGMEAQAQMINFLKNLSIMGGLLSVAVAGPSPISIDHARAPKHPHRASASPA
jgi:putative oxidoreductase